MLLWNKKDVNGRMSLLPLYRMNRLNNIELIILKIPNVFNKVWLENSVSPISSNDVWGQLRLSNVKYDHPTQFYNDS